MPNSYHRPITEEINHPAYQNALDAIQANQMELAHHYLLQALEAEPQNVDLWLLLGWTARTAGSAAYYFDKFREQHPDRDLAGELVRYQGYKLGPMAGKSKASTDHQRELISKVIAYLEKSDFDGYEAAKEIEQTQRHIVVRESQAIELQIVARNLRQKRIPNTIGISLAYLAGLAVAEALTTLFKPQIGLILHGVLLLVIILHAALFSQRSQQRFLITLTLAPLIRLMSLSMPLLNFPLIYWYAVIGMPLLLAVFIVHRMTGFKASLVGLNLRAFPWQILVGLTGLGFGYLEYIILKPEPLVKALNWQAILIPALILLIFTGFLEEIIFRGLIQRSAAATLGRYGLLYVSALFAILHFGYRSVWDVVFVFIVAIFFGLVVGRTGSLLGVTLSHGLTNIALYLVIPFLMNPSTHPPAMLTQPDSRSIATPIVWSMPEGSTSISTFDAIAIDVTPLDKQNIFLENSDIGSPLAVVDLNTNMKPAVIFLPNDDNNWSLCVKIS